MICFIQQTFYKFYILSIKNVSIELKETSVSNISQGVKKRVKFSTEDMIVFVYTESIHTIFFLRRIKC